ncbi:tetratricopeptide repeat protein [Streptomyces sp. NPDC057445]|uniref:tetratricopeptide repeat protein n=1 Tax=Streptomyces sp. NPDC057445 TaxID=3346136 RepID=UPI00369EB298
MNDTDPITTGGVRASGLRAVAAGTIGVAITGDDAQVVMLPPEAVRWAQEVSAPPGAGNLPGSASGVFVGRESELERLREMLIGQGEAAVTQTRAVHGLGGVGKSTLALHYAHRYRAEYTLTWWVTAESPEQINTALAGLAWRLCPQWAATAGTDEQTAWAILWLQWHPGWLLVFDNVEHPDDLRLYLGTLTGGHHVATSRKATGWKAIAPTVPLGLLTPAASADLLCTLALEETQQPTLEQRRQAALLARDLGHLPLALEQAGAYLYQTGTGMDAYRRTLGRMLDKSTDGIDSQRTIACIWNQTLQAITTRDPLAVTLLHTLAWLAPDNLPRALLTACATDPQTLDQALGVLRAYDMITLTGSDITVHRLLQAVLRATAPEPDTPPPGRREAELLMLHALHPDGQDRAPAPPKQWQHLIPHLIALAVTSPAGHHNDGALAAYQTTAKHLEETRQEVRAVPLFKAVLAQRKQVLGANHPETLRSRDQLAHAYYAAGDQGQAIPLYEANLTHRRRVLGDTHPDTLTNRMNLAHAHRMAGEAERAIPLYEQALAESVSALGDSHPDTLTIRIGLAGAYKWAGDLERAIPLFEATFVKYKQVLGDSHPHTLFSRDQLAGAYEASGDFGRAIPLFEATLALCEQVLDNADWLTLRCRSNLADAYQRVGDLERAIPLFETTLAQREQLFGDTHPDTLRSRDCLAHVYLIAGDLERAIPLFETTLAQREQALGHGSVDTLRTRKHLAEAYQAAQAVQQQSSATPTTAGDPPRSPPSR